MDVVTDAMPSAARPQGVASLDEEIGIPSATTRDKIEQNTKSRRNTGRGKKNTCREEKFSQTYEKPKRKNPPNNTVNQNVFNGCIGVHVGNTYHHILQPHYHIPQPHDYKNDMPEYVKKLILLKRCANRSDCHIVALNITPAGFKILTELLGIGNKAKRICEDYMNQGFYEVVFQSLYHWAQPTESRSTGPMVNILCCNLWHIGVRNEGGSDALQKIALEESEKE